MDSDEIIPENTQVEVEEEDLDEKYFHPFRAHVCPSNRPKTTGTRIGLIIALRHSPSMSFT